MSQHYGDPGGGGSGGGSKTGMPVWLIAVLAVGATVMLCVGASFFGAVSILVPRIQEKQTQTQCANQLRQLGGLYITEAMQNPKAPPAGGAAYFVGLARKSGAQPALLLCPGDEHAAVAHPFPASPPESMDATDLRQICSYAVRDFTRYPLEDTADEFIAADAGGHHAKGINVLRSNGAVHFLDREALGLGPDDDIIVGPDSPHPELQKLCIVPAR